MNENINLCEILKDVPKGTKLYSPLFGDVKLYMVNEDEQHVIVETVRGSYCTFYSDGLFSDVYQNGECLLFPAKEQRNWAEFKVEQPKIKVVLHPFDRVLCRDDYGENKWMADILSNVDDELFYCLRNYYNSCIPYNKETAHLYDTTDPCTIDYEIEFSKEFKE